MKKIVAIGIIALFTGLAFAPVIGSQVVKTERISKAAINSTRSLFFLLGKVLVDWGVEWPIAGSSQLLQDR